MSDAKIMIVEDDPIIQEILEVNLKNAGYRTTTLETVSAAWDRLKGGSEKFDVVLLDLNLPDASGIELLKRIKADTTLSDIPVIIQTALSSPEDVQVGLLAGAHYYLAKPIDNVALLAIIRAAISNNQDLVELQEQTKRTSSVMSQLSQARFLFRTPNQARDIAVILSNACREPQKVVLGLSELMLNAVEHGNLAITYDEKSQFLRDDRLADEIELRLTEAKYAGRTAEVYFERVLTEIRFVIRDEGTGFDWSSYLEMSPERIFDSHGRGIAMARMLSFDQIVYEGRGNVVVATIKT
jgi:DNA-binding response OmpR family regulator